MTAKIKIERGIEVENRDICKRCIFQGIPLGVILTCQNKKSDHYLHLITENHPACEHFEEKVFENE